MCRLKRSDRFSSPSGSCGFEEDYPGGRRKERKGGPHVPPIADTYRASVLVPIIAMMAEGALLLSEFLLFVLHLFLIVCQGILSFLRLASLVLVGAPIPRPARFVHFTPFMLEV